MTILLLLKLQGVSPTGLVPGLSRGENTLLLVSPDFEVISHWMDLSLEAFAVCSRTGVVAQATWFGTRSLGLVAGEFRVSDYSAQDPNL